MSTTHSPTLPSLHLRHNTFYNQSVASPTSKLILQPFRSFTYVKTHSTTLPSLQLRHSSFYNPYIASPTSHLILNHSVASPTSQLILQPLRCFTYATWRVAYGTFEDILIQIIRIDKDVVINLFYLYFYCTCVFLIYRYLTFTPLTNVVVGLPVIHTQLRQFCIRYLLSVK